MEKSIALGELETGLQVRVRLNTDVVNSYAEEMKAGTRFPPITVFRVDQTYMVADGVHRVHAAKLAGLPTIRATVKEGTRRDAVLFAVGSNATHGLQRTHEDKRYAVGLLLRDPTWQTWSDNRIAKACHVSHPFVAAVRASLEPTGRQPSTERTFTSRHGTTTTMETGRIGRTPRSGGAPRERAQREPADKMAVHHSSESPEHLTPPHVLEAVVNCLGEIDLDPCSDSTKHVPAKTHYTQEDDGLSKPWNGRTFVNPPYGGAIEKWIMKLVSDFEAGLVTKAILLVPARPGTQWWLRLRNYPCCLITGRLTFGGNPASAPFPSAIFYLGAEETVDDFVDAVAPLGDVWQRRKSRAEEPDGGQHARVVEAPSARRRTRRAHTDAQPIGLAIASAVDAFIERAQESPSADRLATLRTKPQAPDVHQGPLRGGKPRRQNL
jgi:DNA N-6-adenine-methyltransferase (Dam)/ParB-like nuclease domain